MFYYDITILLLIPAMIFAVYAQIKVKSNYSKFSQVATRRGMTGAQAARMILDANGLNYVPIEMVAGELTDHYDPGAKVMRLSSGIYGGNSIASVSVAAHESGHAIQHSVGYGFLNFRTALAPAASFASSAAWPLAIFGLILGLNGIGDLLFSIGLLLYIIAVLFQVVTLPVELDASKRALTIMQEMNIVTDDEEYRGAKKMLSAAAMTYVAAMAVAIVNLIRLLLIRGSRD